LHPFLRGRQKQCRQRYGHSDSRGRLAGKRPITTRPALVDARDRIGDGEADTIVGPEGSRHCVVSLVERQTGYLVLDKLRARPGAEVNRRAIPLLRQHRHPVHENTNGLVRQYIPKRTSMAALTQREWAAIARARNQRPRKRLAYRTPEECYAR
jgi:transposase, IS30 family